MATHFQDEKEAREEIKDVVYLLFGKHILDSQAEEIFSSYKQYMQKEDIALYLYVYTYYALDGFS